MGPIILIRTIQNFCIDPLNTRDANQIQTGAILELKPKLVPVSEPAHRRQVPEPVMARGLGPGPSPGLETPILNEVHASRNQQKKPQNPFQHANRNQRDGT